MNVRKILLVAALVVEGYLLLHPAGVLVRAARGRRRDESELAQYWWRKSPVHLGCSVASCNRPATRTASYQLIGPRNSTWRAYGFCEKHAPPAGVAGLVYRQGRPETLDYEVPLAPVWAETYFLLGIFGFGIWCAGMWRVARTARSHRAWLGLAAIHSAALAGLWIF